jgi:hypothetical protein
VETYYDRYKFPWLRYQVDAPSYGEDYVVKFEYKPSRSFKYYVKFRRHTKIKNLTEYRSNSIATLNQNNYRYHIEYKLLSSVVLKNRIELIRYRLAENEIKNGYMIYQDIKYAKVGSPFSFSMRYALFETDDYDTRIYAYENDVVGAYSIPAFYNKGTRFYVLFAYKFKRGVKLWLKYAQTYYDNTTVINEGTLNEINGNTKSEIKVQLNYKF